MRWVQTVTLAGALCTALLADEQQAAKDATVVETLLRLKTIDVNANPKLQQAVLRHLALHQGTPRYVELVEKLKLRGVEEELLRLALAEPASTQGVHAAALLLSRQQADRLRAPLLGDDETQAVQAATVLGNVGTQEALALLQPLLTDAQRTRAVRTAVTGALGRSRLGERWLLQIVEQGQLPVDLHFAAANVLYASTDERIRSEVAKYLALPATANARPLPPVAELAKRTGDAARGRELFRAKATCGKCHKVRGEGKEVGPDLSEIGSKLSREAMFVSILDPSAGISHNYESYVAVLTNGNIVAGLKVSETDDSLTLRDAESIDKTFAKSEVEELSKSPISLMPADLQKMLDEQELVDVVEYLTSLRKPS